MSDTTEILITSDANGTLWTCCAWDPRAGTNLMTYKGGGAANPHGLTFIKNEFLVAANSLKPLIHIWPVNSQEQLKGARLVTPARVSALAISPDGLYCVAGAAENIYIWQICSGRLLAALSRHYQTVSTIKFIDDGSHFVSAGQDGMVLVWNLATAISQQDNSTQKSTPFYSFSDHALPVSDFHIGKGGMRSYLTTVSLDRTCRIYDLSSGNLLLNLVFGEALTAVTIDHVDTKIYVGTIGGRILEFSIQSPPRMREYHLTQQDEVGFVGHKDAITALSISLDGESLISGSKDENVILWHIPSKQLIRMLPHKGPVTNAFFALAPKSMFDQEVKLNLLINNFKRMTEQDSFDSQVIEVMVTGEELQSNDDADYSGYYTNSVQDIGLNSSLQLNSTHNGTVSSELSGELESLRAEVKNLKRINKDLYVFSSKHILNKK